MVIRLLAVATALFLGLGVAQVWAANSPKAEASPPASTVDPMDVPRGVHDWFAKSVDDMLTDEGPSEDEAPRKR